MKKSSKCYASIYHNILKNVLEKCSVKTVVYYTKNQKVSSIHNSSTTQNLKKSCKKWRAPFEIF